MILLDTTLLNAEILEGLVLSQPNTPLPGVTVYLVHPNVGRSSPLVTNSNGQFLFSNLPLVNEPYYLEIYWGKELIYRKNIGVIQGRVTLPTILLNPLRSEPTRLTKDDFKRMIRERGFHHPEEEIEGDFHNNFEEKRLQGKEVIIDHATGLMWQQSGSSDNKTWIEANQYVNELNIGRYAGFNDWRLPTIEELASLVQPTKEKGLHINPIFDRKQENCWSSDEEKSWRDRAWGVEFDNGQIDLNIKAKHDHVRAVRSIQ